MMREENDKMNGITELRKQWEISHGYVRRAFPTHRRRINGVEVIEVLAPIGPLTVQSLEISARSEAADRRDFLQGGVSE